MRKNDSTQVGWRDQIPVHPAADMFPMMGKDELLALGEDIQKHGLKSPIYVWKAAPREPRMLLDGRNRLEAMEMVDEPTIEDGAFFNTVWCEELHGYETKAQGVVDPWEFVLSVNLHRRHLTSEQKRELIANVLKERPELSNRRLGKLVGAHHTTVGTVRSELEGRGEISHVEKRLDAQGRQQPATKPESAPPRMSEEEFDRERARIERDFPAPHQVDLEEAIGEAKGADRQLPLFSAFVKQVADGIHKMLVTDRAAEKLAEMERALPHVDLEQDRQALRRIDFALAAVERIAGEWRMRLALPDTAREHEERKSEHRWLETATDEIPAFLKREPAAAAQ
jgi:hypothetical protein